MGLHLAGVPGLGILTKPSSIHPENRMPPVSRPVAGRGAVTLRWRLAQADFIRQARMNRGLSQGELAAAATGHTKQTVAALEAGRAQITPEHYRDFADALNVSRIAFAKVMLRYQNPWLFADLFGHDPELEEELQQVPRRSWRRPRRQRQPDPE